MEEVKNYFREKAQEQIRNESLKRKEEWKKKKLSGEIVESNYSRVKRYRKKYPEKYRAVSLLAYQIKIGKIRNCYRTRTKVYSKTI